MVLQRKCDVCGEMRPDAQIDTLTFERADGHFGQYTITYCRDRSSCLEGTSDIATRKAKQ